MSLPERNPERGDLSMFDLMRMLNTPWPKRRGFGMFGHAYDEFMARQQGARTPAGDGAPSTPPFVFMPDVTAPSSGADDWLAANASSASFDRKRLGPNNLPAAPVQSDPSSDIGTRSIADPRAPEGEPAPRISAATIRSMMPRAGRNADICAEPLSKAMRDRGIVSPYEQAAFLAQVGHESGQLTRTREDMTYRTADRLRAVWPSRFPSLEAAAPYVGNPELLANTVYAARNGNGDAASGDGFRYRGGGLLQVTGRANYRLVGHENDPEALAEPLAAADSAAAYWRGRNLGDLPARPLSRREFDQLTRKLNGGLTGADERWALYNRMLGVLAPPP